MPRRSRPLAIAAALALPFAFALAFAAPSLATHPCGDTEASASTCPRSRIRMCAPDSRFASCGCPPGGSASTTSAACSVASSAPAAPSCIVHEARVEESITSLTAFPALEQPPLDVHASDAMRAKIAANDAKTGSLDAASLVALAEAHEAVEGEAARAIGELSGATAKRGAELRDKRDRAVDRAIATRASALVAKPAPADAPLVSVAHARALLRRAGYHAGMPSAEADRERAEGILRDVLSTTNERAVRDAAFMLAEADVRARRWTALESHASEVIRRSKSRIDSEDPAYFSAANVRLTQALLHRGALPDARAALLEAITMGARCSPRTECAMALSTAREVLAGVWAASGSSPRTMIEALRAGTLPRMQRVRPLLALADKYAASSSAACVAAAEEAKAWAKVLE